MPPHRFRAWTFLLAAIGCLIALSAPVRSAEPGAADLAAAFRIVEQAVADGDVPGAVALVAHHGKVLREAAYGQHDLERNLPFQTDTICWIASMTKAITATATMLLIQDGKLGMDDPVGKYLPEFAGRENFKGRHHPFTIRQLLLYTSGLPNNPPTRKGGDRIGGALADVWLTQRLTDIIEGIAQAQLLFEPGTRQEYSSAGYFVLGRLIQAVSGKTYPAFVKERIFDPLGMSDSTYAPPASVAGRMAAVYQEQRGARRLIYRFNPDLKIQNDAGDGGVFSTTRDMAKFEQMFLDNNGTVLSRASVTEMHRAHRPGFVSGSTNNTEVSTAIGFTVKDGLFIHGGSSGVTGWGDHQSGTVGMLFIQFPEDQRKGDRLRTAFRQAVQNALGGTPSPGLPPVPPSR
ncbi:MAG: serine hydrolase domain-containing protein [Opitutaceae bacterium]|nr:serine hydrolase domain-containing protein [Opitutaceae bacterium]